MNKKLILGIASSALLVSTLFAVNGQYDMKKNCGNKSDHHKMMEKGGHHKKGSKIIKMVMKLDLSSSQKMQIHNIMKNNMKNMPHLSSAFSDTSFDKAKFIKLSKERKDNKINKKADTLSKIYDVLNSSQKKALKTMLDVKEQKKMMQHKGKLN